MVKAKTTPLSITKKIGHWVEMTYDRMLTHKGITWLGVKGGMGSQRGREDWVADIPETCISVHDYHWKGPYFGSIRYSSFHTALDGQILDGLENCKQSLRELQEKTNRLILTIDALQKSINDL